LNEKAQANIVISIAGNKIDLDDRQVSKEDAQSFSQEHGLTYYEVSAK
jgi:GTPase SAR1 family protein